ncbi:MAG: LppX_LprAFG lipoprotein [bacterium]|nr:LppX_LprAFG lipoprotein [bacterium]MDE0674874.1 LppX_LprAFG lipoprotein [bacterium]
MLWLTRSIFDHLDRANDTKPFKNPHRRLSITVAMMALASLVAACGGDSSPDPAPDVDVDALLTGAGEVMAAMSTARFSMVDELESGAKFFGTTFKRMETEVESPDSFRMVVDVEAPGFGFVEIEMMAVGEEAYLKLSADAPWNPLPLEQVPFNFSGLGFTLQDLLTTIKDGAVVAGRESLDGVQTIRVDGTLSSEQLSDLISSVDPGHAVSLGLWIDETDHALKQIRIAGRIYNDDAPETVRLLTIEGIDVSVDIELPDLG